MKKKPKKIRSIRSMSSSRPTASASLGICRLHEKLTTIFLYNSISSFNTMPKVTTSCKKACASAGFELSTPPRATSPSFHALAISVALSLMFRGTSGLADPNSGSATTGSRDSRTSTDAHATSFGVFTCIANLMFFYKWFKTHNCSCRMIINIWAAITGLRCFSQGL